jgi:hypothetical protein
VLFDGVEEGSVGEVIDADSPEGEEIGIETAV